MNYSGQSPEIILLMVLKYGGNHANLQIDAHWVVALSVTQNKVWYTCEEVGQDGAAGLKGPGRRQPPRGTAHQQRRRAVRQPAHHPCMCHTQTCDETFTTVTGAHLIEDYIKTQNAPMVYQSNHTAADSSQKDLSMGRSDKVV